MEGKVPPGKRQPSFLQSAGNIIVWQNNCVLLFFVWPCLKYDIAACIKAVRIQNHLSHTGLEYLDTEASMTIGDD